MTREGEGLQGREYKGGRAFPCDMKRERKFERDAPPGSSATRARMVPSAASPPGLRERTGRFEGSFPPATAHRLLLSAPVAAIA